MKNIFGVIVGAALALLPVSSAIAASASSGGATWTYSVADGAAQIDEASVSSASVTVPAKLGGYPVATIGEDAFFECTKLKSVSLPTSVRVIGPGAFYGCTALTRVTFASGLTEIGELAFYGCEVLNSVTLPATVATLGSRAFGDCESLAAIAVDAGNPNFLSSDGVVYTKDGTELVLCPCGREGSFEIPSSVTKVGDAAFATCWSLTSVTFPSTVKSIGVGAFRSCGSLTALDLRPA